jgi:hypothetical protein
LQRVDQRPASVEQLDVRITDYETPRCTDCTLAFIASGYARRPAWRPRFPHRGCIASAPSHATRRPSISILIASPLK